MAGKNTAVFGIYKSRAAVEEAVDALRQAGFRNTDISVLLPENVGTKDFAVKKDTKAPEGATTGAASGAVIGGVLGWLAGIGALAIPGLGPFIAAGPIIGALAGAGTGGAVGGLDNSDWVKRAKEILERTGAEDISSAGEAKADFAKSDKPMPRTAASEMEDPDRVDKPRTRTGGGTA
jgi:hypothetical protein